MLCSIDRTGTRRAHACPGDSGSPLAVRDGSDWVQVGGVVSWGAEVKRRSCDDDPPADGDGRGLIAAALDRPHDPALDRGAGAEAGDGERARRRARVGIPEGIA